MTTDQIYQYLFIQITKLSNPVNVYFQTYDNFQEFKDLCKNLTTDQVEVAFRQFDTSGDEKLNYKEFCLMIIQREQER